MRFATHRRSVALALALLALSPSATALEFCPQTDVFEPNDSCASTTPVANGNNYAGLTVFGAASTLGINDDFFSITLPPYSQIEVFAQFLDVNGDVDVWLWDAAAGTCPSTAAGDWLARGFSSSDDEFFTWDNNSAVPVDCVIRVNGYSTGFDCNRYDLRVRLLPLLVCPGPDHFEPNFTCSFASSIFDGATNSLSITGDSNSGIPDVDYYRYTVGNNEVLVIDVLFLHFQGDIDCMLYENSTAFSCGQLADFGWSTSNNEDVTYTNTSGGPVRLMLQVYSDSIPFPFPHCTNYTLNVSVSPVPCASSADDSFAPNQSCASAAPISEGLTENLFVNKANSDFFKVLLADGEFLGVRIDFPDYLCDLDLTLYDPTLPGCGVGGGIITSAGTSDSEYVSYMNTSGAPKWIDIKVLVWQNLSNPDCNNYDIEIERITADVGVTMCRGDGFYDVGAGPVACPCNNETQPAAGEGCENSTGDGATLTGTGSASVANDDLVLNVRGAVASQTGVFVQGESTIAVQFRDGILCMGNPTERLGVVATNANGRCSSSFSVVTEGNVLPGQTRYYQYWYRDPGGVSPCGTGSNMSSGMRIDYTP